MNRRESGDRLVMSSLGSAITLHRCPGSLSASAMVLPKSISVCSRKVTPMLTMIGGYGRHNGGHLHHPPVSFNKNSKTEAYHTDHAVPLF